jgi:hypothetical protein
MAGQGQDSKRSSGGAEPASPPSPPSFRRARKGWDPAEVGRHLEEVERDRAGLRAALADTEAQRVALRHRVEGYEAIEGELTRSVHLAKQTGEAVVADARRRAEELLAAASREVEALHEAGRARLTEEERSLDGLRMAVAAEAAMLKDVERQLATRISRAAAALVELVDAPGGLGPFSQATATLLEFAQLLHRASMNGTPVQVRLELDEGTPVARVAAAGSGPPGVQDGWTT